MSWLWNALDYVPVVGTVKNGAEAVVSLIDGDKQGAAIKGTQALIGGTLDVLTFGTSGAIGKLAIKEAAKQSGKTIAKNVAGKVAAEAVVNVGGRMAYSKVSEIKRRTPWNIEPDNSQMQRPARRGEHVINNNVLRVYRDIIDGFVGDVTGMDIQSLVDTGRLSSDSRIVQAYYQPLPEEFMDLIRNRMVVYVDEEYLDKNSINYGQQIEILRGSVGMYMRSIYENLTSNDRLDSNSFGISSWERQVRTIVEDFIAGNYFVDEQALEIWLRKRGNDQNTYDGGHREVVKMFRRLIYDGTNDDVIQWVKELVDLQNA